MKIVYLAMAFLLAGSMVPQSFAASAREQAVAMAAENSKSSIESISVALYEAILANPSEAVSICEEVLSQRSSWSVSECEVLMRAVLLARPDIKAGLVNYTKGKQSASTGQSTAPAEESASSAADEAASSAADEAGAVSPEVSALVNVFSQVAIGGAATDVVIEHVTHDAVAPEVGASESVIPPTITDVVPSPGDMSVSR